ncbi:MAG TPA: DUF4235 domain-containing protein [Gemmatimonadaceae bacterium]
MRIKQQFVSRKATWLLVSGAAAMVAGRLVERGLETGYRKVKNDDPPEKPWKRGESWPTALGWAALSAAAVATAQLAAKRGAQLGLQRVTGKRPPRSV